MKHHNITTQLSSVFPLLLVTTLFLLFFLFNPQVIADWRVYSFDDGSYSHAYLMVPVIAFLYWRAWQQQQLQVRWNPWFFMLLVASLLLYLWLTVAQQAFFSRLALPLVLIFALASLLRVNASLLVPVILVWFITPIWNVLNSPLQDLSVLAVNRIMDSTNVPTLVEANLIHIPAGTFAVAGGCSGLRYLVTALALSVIYCFLSLRRIWTIALFFLIAITGALVTNWVRIAILVYVGHVTDMESELIGDHNMFGWYLFIPFTMVLFFVGNRLEPYPDPPAPLRSMDGRVALPITAVALALVVLSGVGIHFLQSGSVRWVAPIFDVETEQAASDSVAQPAPLVYAWTRRDSDLLYMEGVEIERQRYVFGAETDAHKADFYLNSPVPRGWEVLGSEVAAKEAWLRVSAPDGKPAVIVYSFRVGDRQTPDRERFSRHRLLEAATLNQRTELLWALAYCQGDCDEVLRVLRQAQSRSGLWGADSGKKISYE